MDSRTVSSCSTSEVGGGELALDVRGSPIAVIRPCSMTCRAARPRAPIRANCSTTSTETPLARDLADLLVQLLDDLRRQAHRQLVEQQQRGVGRRAPGPSRASAARRRTSCRRAACGARPGAGTGRRRPSSTSLGRAAGVGDQPQVLGDGEVREDAAALGDRAHPGAGERVGRGAVDVRRRRRGRAPAVGAHLAAITLSVVVLPAPFGPSSATTCRAGTRRSTPCSTSMRPYAGVHVDELEDGGHAGPSSTQPRQLGRSSAPR